MTEVYFHCSDAEHVLIDRRGATMNLAEARNHSEHLVRSLLMTPGASPLRDCDLHDTDKIAEEITELKEAAASAVTDEFGEEIFALPFASVLGKPH